MSGRTKRGKTEALAIWLVALAGSADRAAAAAIDHVRSADASIRDRKTVETCGYAQVRSGSSRIQLSVSVARFLLFGAEGIMTKPATGPTAAVLIAIVSLGRSAVAYQAVTPDLARAYHTFLTGKARMTVKDALDGAVRRLAKPRCQQVFEQFTDQKGRTLTANLAAVGKAGADFLANLYFVDGAETIQCRTDDTIAAFTAPGSRVIHVCGTRFAERFAANTKGGEMVLIHELLCTHSAWLRTRRPVRKLGMPLELAPLVTHVRQ